MAQREIQHVVEHAMEDLPEAFRIVFITRVIEGAHSGDDDHAFRCMATT
jgi:DNA-directed RNA polymerase specialized sigma24 family protein